MKLTKARLQQIIKEEVDAMRGDAGQFRDLPGGGLEPSSTNVYIISEPSMTYGGEGTEIKLLGVYLDKSAAVAALESLLSAHPGTTAEVFAVPANKIDRYGYTA